MVAYARWSRAVGAATTALALAACSGTSCSLVGCASQVRVSLTELSRQNPASPLSVHLCVDSVCTDQTVTPEAEADAVATGDVPTAVTSGEQRQVRVSVRVGVGRRVLADSATTASIEPFAPNGGGDCGPVCYVAKVTLRDGRLVDTVAGTS